jgi:hypothetical protein
MNYKDVFIYILNRMQQSGKWISGVGKLILRKEINKSNISPENYDASIIERAKYLQKKHINIQFSRNHKLSTKLVKEFDLNILFNPKIW